jgi:hypothetical protein
VPGPSGTAGASDDAFQGTWSGASSYSIGAMVLRGVSGVTRPYWSLQNNNSAHDPDVADDRPPECGDWDGVFDPPAFGDSTYWFGLIAPTQNGNVTSGTANGCTWNGSTNNVGQNGATLAYGLVNGSASLSTNQANNQSTVAFDVTVSTLSISGQSQTSSNSYMYTLYVNGSPTTLTCTVPNNGTSCTDPDVEAVVVTAGQVVQLEAHRVGGSSTSSRNANWSLTFSVTVP